MSRTWICGAVRDVVLLGVGLALAGCSMSRAPGPVTGGGAAAGPAPESSASAVATPVYVLDPSFPQPSIPFNQVSWMRVDRKTALVYLLQRSQPPVSLWTPAGELVGTWDTEVLGEPHSISFEDLADGSRRVWITDMAPPRSAGVGFGHCLKVFDMDGGLLGTLGTCGPDSEGTGLDPVQFDQVTDVAFDDEGERWVTDGDVNGLNNRLLEIDPAGTVLRHWNAPGDQPGSGPGEFDLPHAVLLDPCQRKWVADARNHRIQVFGAEGDFVGELACFGELGVFGIALTDVHASGEPAATLFATASPTSGGGTGTVYLFEVTMDCSEPRAIGSCTPVTRWDIELLQTGQTALLHAVTTEPDGSAIYISLLGGPLPPQKWVRVPVGASEE